MIVERAPAKINLALHVRHRRPDGYHAIETLFAFARDGDAVSVELAAASSFTITGPFAAALSTLDNLVLAAIEAFASAFGTPGPLAIGLDKNLPVASGIGGGSADAAAVLRALARLTQVSPDDPRLAACAVELGADVPACLLGRAALGTGRGEQLAPLDGLAGTPLLLVNPRVAVSTAAVFARWDGEDRGPIAEGGLLDRALSGRNDLEAPARAIAPVIGDVLAVLGSTGAPLLTRMSGSGATCFALYRDATERAHAAAAIRASHPDWWCLESALA
ncbi:4-diphosphocytidyl-2-C-methyl-D-erythritol kinase [Hephaestia caeni]|uniref:4-diphosphocytidyl-2-C-methyl-D-erythritol kinase n=1 Tax=Hephaestia caeni TaxID=645617 RepID=A0A397PJL4_9SPHN|nr:4-(cytidine 5'-diphospho)-2-C-methyl-D-erythritol kinase [Hephaestia caeni]RIA45891.1 4-diphosphocytidyl-2-C-methyl-D-erythritol kinase [Hephaestia caeni]